MTITVTKKEYDAISFAICQVENELESAEYEEYVEEAKAHISALYNIMEKYRKAWEKAKYFQMVRAEVSKRNRHLRPRDIDKLGIYGSDPMCENFSLKATKPDSTRNLTKPKAHTSLSLQKVTFAATPLQPTIQNSKDHDKGYTILRLRH